MDSISGEGDAGATTSIDTQADMKCQPAESIGEWRSFEQLEASSPSTRPPSWESDEDDYLGSSDLGPRPSDLYGKFTWKIENFSHINKRELRSNVFEVGGYKWYILVYPQGCDVCNHLSLFLCVADYDKLLPGWSHFAQFTIAVVNKDPKKSKYSDTLHRFCKKEHDWGWKKFMELSNVADGFTVAETLVIKAQVQVIRENPHRPFRCLDCQYRRELVRVYLTNVEGICRRFVDEKREKIGKLMEDTVRWSSFCAFWSAVEESTRRRLVREKTDVILKAVLKRFFNEKEVTSTLVMDALYSGCKALDHCTRNKKWKINGVEMEETINPVVCMEKGAFMLTGDVLSLLERAAAEPLPYYKDDKGPQNRTKDANFGEEFGKDSVERDERRLIELGRRTVEMFVLAYVFSNRVEVAYREAIALKRQEELIREEEAAGQAEIELKAKREAAEKEKRTKKKQAKQRRNNRKDKEKEIEEKHVIIVQQPLPRGDTFSARVVKSSLLKIQQVSSSLRVGNGDAEDDLSNIDITDDVVDVLGPAREDGDADCEVWGRDRPAMHREDMVASFSGAVSEDSAQSGQCHRKQHQALLDDSSSTCSSDSLPSITPRSNGSIRGRLVHVDSNQAPVKRGRGRLGNGVGCDTDVRLLESDVMIRCSLDADGTIEPSSSCSTAELDAETVILSLKERIQWLEQRLAEKEEEVVMQQERLSLFQHQMGIDRPGYERNLAVQTAGCTKMLGYQDFALSGRCNVNCNLSTIEPKDGQDSQDLGMDGGQCPVISGQPLDLYHSSEVHDPISRQEVKKEIMDHYEHGSSQCRSMAASSTREVELSVCQACPPSISLVPPNSASEELARTSACHVDGPSPIIVEVSELSRPSIAPVAAGPQSTITPTQWHSVQALARSVNAAVKLDSACVETKTASNPAIPQCSSVTPSYRNAAAGKMRSNNSAMNGGILVPSVGASISSSTPNAACFPYIDCAFTHGSSLPIPSTVPSASDLLSFTSDSVQMPLMCVPAMVVDGEIVNPKAIHEPASAFDIAGTAETGTNPNVDTLENVGDYQSMNRQTSVGFTFGTITPEILHFQHQQIQQHGYDVSQQHIDHSHHVLHPCGLQEPHLHQLTEERRHPMEYQNYHVQVSHHHCQPHHHCQQVQLSQNYHHQQSSSENGSANSAVGQAMATVIEKVNTAEEFPHLDIINDLLDEDKNRGKMLNAFIQQPARQDFRYHLSFLDLHNVNSSLRDPETGIVHGTESEKGVSSGDGCPELPNPEDHTSLLRESLHLRGPSNHPSLSHLLSHQSGPIDGISGHHWPGVNVRIPVNGTFNPAAQMVLDAHLGYPLQSHHFSMTEGPALSFVQNGYAMHSPSKQQ